MVICLQLKELLLCRAVRFCWRLSYASVASAGEQSGFMYTATAALSDLSTFFASASTSLATSSDLRWTKSLRDMYCSDALPSCRQPRWERTGLTLKFSSHSARNACSSSVRPTSADSGRPVITMFCLRTDDSASVIWTSSAILVFDTSGISETLVRLFETWNEICAFICSSVFCSCTIKGKRCRDMYSRE